MFPLYTGLSVFFQSSMYLVNETEGTRKICVVLSTTSSEIVTVQLESSDGTATAGARLLSSLGYHDDVPWLP